ncbi:MAG: hypothetical protein M3O36_15040, partial [Myxococcota bacterium]|nr:hypothetical protein [Myxococcota bacterium]
MRFELRALVAGLAIATTACTSILGLTDVPDASVGEGQDGQVSAPGDAAAVDGTIDASTSATSAPGDSGDSGMDVVTDAATVVTTVTCTPGGACSPNDCQNGTWACTDAGRVCQETTALPSGTPCGAGGDAGARVCSTGACVACNAGGDCSDPATPCIKKSVDCSAGTSQCKVTGNVADGAPCGTGLY